MSPADAVDDVVFEEKVTQYLRELPAATAVRGSIPHRRYVEQCFGDVSEAIRAWESGFERSSGVTVTKTQIHAGDIVAYLEDRDNASGTVAGEPVERPAKEEYVCTQQRIGHLLTFLGNLDAIQYLSDRSDASGRQYNISGYGVEDEQALQAAFQVYWPDITL